MGNEIGFLKYVIKTPFTPVGFVSMYIFGGFFLTLFNTFFEIFSGNFIGVFLEYFIYNALPPTSLQQIFVQVAVGSLVAGFKWYMAMSKIKTGWF